jgi:pentatricopeptide repeat protein
METDSPIAEAESPQADPEEMSVASGVAIKLDNDLERGDSVTIKATPVEISQDSWPFDWSKVDVPGSPGLSRLFKALEIESSHIPPLHLDEPDADTSSCLSKSEMQEVFNSTEKTASEIYHSPLPSQIRRYDMSLQGELPRSSPQYPWRNIEGVFFGYTTSPLMEIYVFPPSPPRNPHRNASRAAIPLWTEYQMEETELKNKFAKLKQQLPEDSPAIVAVMEDLADSLWDVQKYDEAEAIYRKLVDIYRRNSEPNSIKVLETCLSVIDCVRLQGDLSKAKNLNEILRSAIMRLVQPNHPLALAFVRNDASLAEDIGLNKKSERLHREVLQITLSSYGLRDKSTIRAISELGKTLFRVGQEAGELLLRTAVELSLEEPDESDKLGSEIMADLAWALNYSGNAEESYNMSTKAVEQFSSSLGRKDQFIMDLQEQRAWSMIDKGMFAESEILFREQLLLYSVRGGGGSRTDLANVWCGLADALSKMGCIGEATSWYEKSFHERVSYGKAAHPATTVTCCSLADCYEKQGRFDDALAVYRRTIQKIREFGQDPNGVIPELEEEIFRIEERLEHSAHSSGSDEEGYEDYSSVDGEGHQEGDDDMDAERLEQSYCVRR